MSDLILVETVDNVINNISNINEHENTKSYNIDYDINDRLRFLQEKYKDYEFKILKNTIRYRKKETKCFHECCINFDCKTRSNFCIVGETKPTHCKNCSLLSDKEMIDIYAKNKKCIICNETTSCFCIKGETKATHCKDCSILSGEEMIDIANKSQKCIVCNKTRASFCIEGETKSTHCKDCSLETGEEMIDIYAKNIKCIVCNITQTTFNFKGEIKATHCGTCKIDNMIDIINSKCKNIIDGIQCETRACNKQYDGFCFDCYFKINADKIPTKNIKIKEKNIIEFVKLTYTQEIRDKLNIKNIIFDKYSGLKRPDIAIICETYVIIIEVDEFQHKKNGDDGFYSKENEENKMKLIKEYYKLQNKKTIYVRFNPDDYKTKDNKKIKSPWKENENRILVLVDETDWNNRLEILKKKIDFYLKKKVIKNNSTNYLFYDGYKN